MSENSVFENFKINFKIFLKYFFKPILRFFKNLKIQPLWANLQFLDDTRNRQRNNLEIALPYP